MEKASKQGILEFCFRHMKFAWPMTNSSENIILIDKGVQSSWEKSALGV
jgi:hypothetical protein